MRIRLKVEGGLTGIQCPEKRIDTDVLSTRQAQAIEKLVEEAGFFELPAETVSRTGCDLMHYIIEVADRERRHQVIVDDATIGSDLASLVDVLRTT